MMRKIGCVREGVRRKVIYTNGKYHDLILYGLTREEFIENENKLQGM